MDSKDMAKVFRPDMERCVPHLSCEHWNLHHYGRLYRVDEAGELERADVSHTLSQQATSRLNRIEGVNNYKAGELSDRFETFDELLLHAERTAKAVWGWQYRITRLCYECTPDEYRVRYHETTPGEFVKQMLAPIIVVPMELIANV